MSICTELLYKGVLLGFLTSSSVCSQNETLIWSHNKYILLQSSFVGTICVLGVIFKFFYFFFTLHARFVLGFFVVSDYQMPCIWEDCLLSHRGLKESKLRCISNLSCSMHFQKHLGHIETSKEKKLPRPLMSTLTIWRKVEKKLWIHKLANFTVHLQYIVQQFSLEYISSVIQKWSM